MVDIRRLVNHNPLLKNEVHAELTYSAVLLYMYDMHLQKCEKFQHYKDSEVVYDMFKTVKPRNGKKFSDCTLFYWNYDQVSEQKTRDHCAEKDL